MCLLCLLSVFQYWDYWLTLLGRFILLCINCFSLLKKILTLLLPKLKSCIKDDWDFLKKFPKGITLLHQKIQKPIPIRFSK